MFTRSEADNLTARDRYSLLLAMTGDADPHGILVSEGDPNHLVGPVLAAVAEEASVR